LAAVIGILSAFGGMLAVDGVGWGKLKDEMMMVIGLVC
jgi:hypothetical protein